MSEQKPNVAELVASLNTTTVELPLIWSLSTKSIICGLRFTTWLLIVYSLGTYNTVWALGL